MTEYLLRILNSDLIQKYIVLITGLTVFVLTSIYNHWRDRSLFVKQQDTSIDFRYGVRNAVNPKDERITEGRQSLLKGGHYNLVSNHGKENPDFRVRYLILENVGENMVFDIRIKARLLYGARDFKSIYHLKKVMDKKEVFYIPVGSLSYPKKVRTRYFIVKYKSSSGSKYMIINFRLRRKYKSINIKFKKFAGIFWIPREFRLYHSKYSTRYEPLK